MNPRKKKRRAAELSRAHKVRLSLESEYARMAKDRTRENEAAEWVAATFRDIICEPR